ncbi:hypothetical protein AAZV13_12G133250 [Glycine max]
MFVLTARPLALFASAHSVFLNEVIFIALKVLERVQRLNFSLRSQSHPRRRRKNPKRKKSPNLRRRNKRKNFFFSDHEATARQGPPGAPRPRRQVPRCLQCHQPRP